MNNLSIDENARADKKHKILKAALKLAELCAKPKYLSEFDWAWLNEVSRRGKEIMNQLDDLG